MRARKTPRFVFASSAAVYGQPEAVPIPEDASTDPTSPYGLSKLAAERYVRLYAELYDLPAVALWYFNVYGPGKLSGDYSAVISVFVEQASSGEPITVEGDGSQTRDFVHVRNVVRANLLAARSDVTGVFNVRDQRERVGARAGRDRARRGRLRLGVRSRLGASRGHRAESGRYFEARDGGRIHRVGSG